MKHLFSSYYQPSEDELKALWATATFVFDTSVLLNLYRYQQKRERACCEC